MGDRQIPETTETVVSDGQLISAVREGAQTTRQVADALGVPMLSIRLRMLWLCDQGFITRVGRLKDGTTNVWAVPTSDRAPAVASENSVPVPLPVSEEDA